MMPMWIKLAVAAIAAIFLYTAGYESAQNACLKTQLRERSILVNNYDAYITKLKSRQDKLESEVQEYKRASTALSADAERLRAKLASTRATTCPVDKSKPTAETDSGRVIAMAKALEFATNLIEERDLIALQYNELRTQCNLH